MSIRREPTYLSTDVWRALLIMAKARSTDTTNITADQMADILLRQTIEANAPQLFEHQKQVAKLESELLKTL